MKVFCAASVARFYLLGAIGFLACHMTKWDGLCDERLHRLMGYIKTTLEYRQCAWTDGNLSSIDLHLYADADFAGCQRPNKSTTGAFMSVEGPYTKFPVAAMAKGHKCVSHSTPEAEMVAGATALR